MPSANQAFPSFDRLTPSEAASELSPEKILIVDDDPGILKSLNAYFKRRGFPTFLAVSGEEALQTFESEKPPIVLADVGLPTISGLDVLREIRQRDPDAAMILMTGNPERDMAISGMRAGAMDFLCKPFSLDELRSAVDNAVQRHQVAVRDRLSAEAMKRMVDQKDESLRQTQRELSQSAKMGALGELTAGLTHEINQPLTALKLTCQDLLISLGTPELPLEDMKQAVQDMIGHVDMISDIVRHMRNFARSSDNDNERLDVNHVLRDVVNLTHRQFRGYDITLRMDLRPDLPPLVGSRTKIEQVAMNLISNARDALAACNKPNKTIVVSSRLRDNAGGRELLLSVQDNADGIPRAYRDKIFQPLFTTKPDGHGTGLGLSISKRIIESLGGQLRFDTEEGVGTTFYVTLPQTRLDLSEAA